MDTRMLVSQLTAEGQTPTEVARHLGISRQRVGQLLQPEKHAARQAVQAALKNGDMLRPSLCGRCGRPGIIQAHHEDYSKPLEVQWLCQRCHTGKTYGTAHLSKGTTHSIRCGSCGGACNTVVDTRHSQAYVRRRRVCESCGDRVTTYESANKPTTGG